MMSLKDLIAAAFNKDATAFESAFSSVMKEKVASAIDSQFLAREEYELEEAKKDDEDEDEEDEDEDEMCEEVEQIDENIKNLGDRILKFHATTKTPHGTYSQEELRKEHERRTKYDSIYRNAKPAYTKEEVDQIDEISGAKLGTYMIKARKSEAELDKKRDDSYDKPNTPENKAERKAISRTLNKRRWGHGKALDKLTGSSFAKVPATEK